MNLVKYQQVTNEPTSRRRRWGWEKVFKKAWKMVENEIKNFLIYDSSFKGL